MIGYYKMGYDEAYFNCSNEHESEYKEDCYFYTEEHDMGATIPFCALKEGFSPINKCPEDCKNYICNKKVFSIVKKYVEENN